MLCYPQAHTHIMARISVNWLHLDSASSASSTARLAAWPKSDSTTSPRFASSSYARQCLCINSNSSSPRRGSTYHLQSHFRVCALQSHHHGHLDIQLARCSNNGRGNHVTLCDAYVFISPAASFNITHSIYVPP
jgi:hypothetical protein